MSRRKWIVRSAATLGYAALVVLVWAVLGLSHEGPVCGGIAALRVTWPLLVGLALPLVVFMRMAWKAEDQ